MRSISPAECAARIRKAQSICALSGAGISTAAGIPDFRGPQGIYTTRQYNPETVFDIHHFRQDPTEFFRFARDMLHLVGELEPTFTHRFFAELERTSRFDTLITQNIDPLHQLAGSTRVIPIHGNFATAHCQACGKEYAFETTEPTIRAGTIPRCDCAERGVIKPDVVFFGEAVNGLDEAFAAAARSDLFFVLGSSLTVYPAALLPREVKGTLVVVNKGMTDIGSAPNLCCVDSDLDGFFKQVATEL